MITYIMQEMRTARLEVLRRAGLQEPAPPVMTDEERQEFTEMLVKWGTFLMERIAAAGGAKLTDKEREQVVDQAFAEAGLGPNDPSVPEVIRQVRQAEGAAARAAIAAWRQQQAGSSSSE
jgi:hypothetical protein